MTKSLLLALALTSVSLAGCAEEGADTDTVIVDPVAVPETMPADDMMMEDTTMMEDGMMADTTAMEAAPMTEDTTTAM